MGKPPSIATDAVVDPVRAEKLAAQRKGSEGFWASADWSKEEKSKTLAAADAARNTTINEVKSGKWRKYLKLPKKKDGGTLEPIEMTFEALEVQVKEELGRAERQQQAHQSEHAKSDKALAFLNDFLQFVGEFSGVIEVMKGVDEGYGGAAYTALSVFLAVVVNTTRKDEMIATAMISLRENYSRMVIISEIYPTPKMRRYISSAYALGLEFVQEARVYYTRSTSRRLLESITKPPFTIDRKITEISAAMTRIKEERDTLLNKRVHDMEIKLHEIDNKVDGIDGAVDEIDGKVDGLVGEVNRVKEDVGQATTDTRLERVSAIREGLSHHLINPPRSVEKYSSLLEDSFQRPFGLPRYSFEALEATAEYNKWVNHKHSCMLLLHGETTAAQTSLCWLSPAATGLATSLKSRATQKSADRKTAVAEVYCETIDLPSKDIRESPISETSVIVSFILQLLGAAPSTLSTREAFSRIQTRLKPFTASARDTSSEENDRLGPGRSTAYDEADLSRACDLLVRECLSPFDEVYLIIDRADRVSGPGRFIKDLMTRLVDPDEMDSALRRSNTKVKILCVAARECEDMRKIDRVRDEVDESALLSLRVDQYRT